MDQGDVTEPFSGSGTLVELQASFVRTFSTVLFIAVHNDGTLVYANRASGPILGLDSADLLGTNVLDQLHPDDVDRAVAGLAWRDPTGRAAPVPGHFRVRRGDGSWVPMESLTTTVDDGAEQYIGICLWQSPDVAADTVLKHLLSGASRADALTPVLDAISWREYGSLIAIAWHEGDMWMQVGTAVPDALAGVDDTAGSPWDECRHGLCRVSGGSKDERLSEEARALTEQLGLSGFWIEPVPWSPASPAATVTVWTAGDHNVPTQHAYGIGLARDLTELILRWTDQAARRDELANHDALTGLVNRRVFLEHLINNKRHGAVLYCDLDNFKPVNDSLGHAIGDKLLQVVAERLLGCVRQQDIVCRLGGDEFVIFCDGASHAGSGIGGRPHPALIGRPDRDRRPAAQRRRHDRRLPHDLGGQCDPHRGGRPGAAGGQGCGQGDDRVRLTGAQLAHDNWTVSRRVIGARTFRRTTNPAEPPKRRPRLTCGLLSAPLARQS